jgi:hypothetical protein
MSRPLLIRVDDQPPQPWRNGGGVTRELYAWPAGAAWRWRISVADITQDGPFSAFDGVDRWFAVVQGAGVRLALPDPDGRRVELDTTSEPLAFAGEAAPDCALIDGPTRDLNLMLRRAAGSAGLQRVRPGVPWACAAPLRAMFCAETLSLQIEGQAPLTVPAWTLAVSPQGAHERWRVEGDSAAPLAWWLHFQAGGGVAR